MQGDLLAGEVFATLAEVRATGRAQRSKSELREPQPPRAAPPTPPLVLHQPVVMLARRRPCSAGSIGRTGASLAPRRDCRFAGAPNPSALDGRACLSCGIRAFRSRAIAKALLTNLHRQTHSRWLPR